MKRHDFISVVGQSALLAAFSNACSPEQSLPDSRQLVGTPEKRAAYLAKMLKALCTDLGPRPVGSEAYNRAALVVKREMELSLPVVSLDTFTLENWEMTGEPELYIGDERIDAYPSMGSLGTPSEGISGIIQEIDDKVIPYGVVEPESGELLAYIYVWNGAGRARSCRPFGKQPKCLPLFIIGKADEEVVKNALQNRIPVRLHVRVDFVPDTPTSNVIGTLPGESSDEVVFMAHLDSVYSSPGANDNAASLITILMLAHAAKETRPKNTLTFVASAAEEIGYYGAKHFVEKRKSAGTVHDIKYSFNFDSVTWGPNIHIQTSDEQVCSLFEMIDREKHIKGRLKPIDRDGTTLDNTPFKGTETHCIYVGSSGYDTNPFCWHRPNDIPANVPVDCVEITYQLFREYLKRVQGV